MSDFVSACEEGRVLQQVELVGESTAGESSTAELVENAVHGMSKKAKIMQEQIFGDELVVDDDNFDETGNDDDVGESSFGM